jgi:hypothetical protein
MEFFRLERGLDPSQCFGQFFSPESYPGAQAQLDISAFRDNASQLRGDNPQPVVGYQVNILLARAK